MKGSVSQKCRRERLESLRTYSLGQQDSKCVKKEEENQEMLGVFFDSDFDEQSSEEKPTKKTKQKSLTELTRKLVDLFEATTKPSLSVNEIGANLNISKRRVYDLTNILDGLGYLVRVKRNQYKFVVPPAESQAVIFKMASGFKKKKTQRKTKAEVEEEKWQVKVQRLKEEWAEYIFLEFDDLVKMNPFEDSDQDDF